MGFIIAGLACFYLFLDVGAITRSDLTVFIVLFCSYCLVFW